MYAELERRTAQIEQQLAAATAESGQRSSENTQLSASSEALSVERDRSLAEAAESSDRAKKCARNWPVSSSSSKCGAPSWTDSEKPGARAPLLQRKLVSDLQHLEETCLNDLGMEASALRRTGSIADLSPDALHDEDDACRSLKQKLESMGPVNMMALEEYKETAQRHGFLENQRKDLLDSIENTQTTIKEIDQISRIKFDEAFGRINENFSHTFARLFGGGHAFMRLTDAENYSDSGIDIVAQPPGKKLQNVLLLSGGEKALTALSLLIGIFLYQPSPFCVLDEVDAPLDETNVGRLADMLQGMSSDTQFVLVTHSSRMMQAADLIYGVTMQEPGVSKSSASAWAASNATPPPRHRLLTRAPSRSALPCPISETPARVIYYACHKGKLFTARKA